MALLIFEILYSRRAWCRYFCPVGVSYQLIGLMSPLRIKWDKANCSNCKRCQSVCLVPHVLIDSVNQGTSEYVNSSACTRCGLCVDICDDEALSYGVKYLDKLIWTRVKRFNVQGSRLKSPNPDKPELTIDNWIFVEVASLGHFLIGLLKLIRRRRTLNIQSKIFNHLKIEKIAP